MAALAPAERHTLFWDRPTDPNPAWAPPDYFLVVSSWLWKQSKWTKTLFKKAQLSKTQSEGLTLESWFYPTHLLVEMGFQGSPVRSWPWSLGLGMSSIVYQLALGILTPCPLQHQLLK